VFRASATDNGAAEWLPAGTTGMFAQSFSWETESHTMLWALCFKIYLSCLKTSETDYTLLWLKVRPLLSVRNVLRLFEG
jgi:hypothetical protein